MKAFDPVGCGMGDPFEKAWMVLKKATKGTYEGHLWTPPGEDTYEQQMRDAGMMEKPEKQEEVDLMTAQAQQIEAMENWEAAREMDQFYYWNPDLAQTAGIDATAARTAMTPDYWNMSPREPVFATPEMSADYEQMSNPQLQYGHNQYMANQPAGHNARSMLQGQGYQASLQQPQQPVQRLPQGQSNPPSNVAQQTGQDTAQQYGNTGYYGGTQSGGSPGYGY